MIITNIRSFFFDLPGAGSIQGYSWKTTSHILIAIETDSHFWGFGEGTPYLAGSYENLHIINELRKYLLNRSIENARLMLSDIQRKFMPLPGFDYAAFLAVDSALIDIISKISDKKYSEVLGGNSRSHPVYGTVFLDDVESMINRSIRWSEKGVNNFKIKISGNVKRDLDNIERIVDAIGKTNRIRVDANGSFTSVSHARAILRPLSKMGVSEVEQPFPVGALSACRRIKQDIDMKIFLDEDVTGITAIEKIWKSKSADGIHIHPSKFGCLEITKENIEFAEMNGLDWSLGASGMTSIGASMHLALLDSFSSVEYPAEEIGHFEQYGCDIVSNPLRISEGTISLNSNPFLSKKALLKHAIPSLTYTRLIKKLAIQGFKKIPLSEFIASHFEK